MNKIKKFLNAEFQHHHAFFLIIASIGIFFSGNVFAYKTVTGGVTESDTYKPPIVVERKETLSETDEKDPNSLDGSVQTLRDFVDNAPVTAGIWLQDLKTGDYIGENDSVVFESASMYKLFVAYETYRRIDLGIHTPDEIIDTEDGPRSIDYCLEASITVSDNACGRALRELVRANVEPLPSLAEAGFVGTSLVNDYPTTSAKDVALLFQKIYDGTDLSPVSNTQFLENLSAQTVNNRIPAGLPAGLQIAHKTGDLEGYSHDGGIIFSPKGDYILVIMSGPWQNGYDDVTETISKFVADLYATL